MNIPPSKPSHRLRKASACRTHRTQHRPSFTWPNSTPIPESRPLRTAIGRFPGSKTLKTFLSDVILEINPLHWDTTWTTLPAPRLDSSVLVSLWAQYYCTTYLHKKDRTCSRRQLPSRWLGGARPPALFRTTYTQGLTPHTCTGAPLRSSPLENAGLSEESLVHSESHKSHTLKRGC